MSTIKVDNIYLIDIFINYIDNIDKCLVEDGFLLSETCMVYGGLVQNQG